MCGFYNIPRSMLRYRAHPRDDSSERRRIRELSQRHPRRGCPTIHGKLRSEGCIVNHKKTHQIYKEELLGLRRKRQRIRLHGSGVALAASQLKNEVWALDFMSESFQCGRKFRLLNIIDEGTRQALSILCNVSIRSTSVVAELEHLGSRIGFPRAVRTDNGPEFRSRRFQAWARYRGVRIIYIDPGEPSQNAYIESFNARVVLECFAKEYNSERSHSALEGLTPDAHAARLDALHSTLTGSAPLAAPVLTRSNTPITSLPKTSQV